MRASGITPNVKGDTVPSFAILTDEPNGLVAPYHDRMPVVIEDPEKWLDPDTTLNDLSPLGPEAFEVRPVNRAVNKVATKDIAAIEAPQAEGEEAQKPVRNRAPRKASRS